jgi:hypothetical protein
VLSGDGQVRVLLPLVGLDLVACTIVLVLHHGSVERVFVVDARVSAPDCRRLRKDGAALEVSHFYHGHRIDYMRATIALDLRRNRHGRVRAGFGEPVVARSSAVTSLSDPPLTKLAGAVHKPRADQHPNASG